MTSFAEGFGTVMMIYLVGFGISAIAGIIREGGRIE